MVAFFADARDAEEEAPEANFDADEEALVSVLVGVAVRCLAGGGGEGCEGGAALEDCVDKDDGVRPVLAIPDIKPTLSALTVDAGLDSAGRSAGLTEEAGRGKAGRLEALRFDVGLERAGRSASLTVDAGLGRGALSVVARPAAPKD